MKQSMKKKLVAVSVTAATLMGSMMFAGNAAAEDAQFNMRVNIVSSNECAFNVDLPDQTGNTFSATWTKINTDPSTMVLDADSAASEDAVIGVSMNPGAPDNCVLNSTALETTAQDGTAVGMGTVRVGMEDGAQWRFTPTLVNVKLYNNTDYTSQAPGTVSVTSASGAALTVKNTILNGFGRGALLTGQGSFFGTKTSVPYMVASDLYMSGLSSQLLATGSLTGMTTIKAADTAGDIKSARYYIGGLFVAQPTDAVGNINEKLAVDGDSTNFPFVVTVTAA